MRILGNIQIFSYGLLCFQYIGKTEGVEVFNSLLKMIFSDTALKNISTDENVTQNMQVIGAGFSRTGTDSLKTALTKLGYKSYHGQNVMTEKNHLYFWNRYFLENDQTIFSIIKNQGYNATTDYPGCLVFDKYLELYPNAKVILSLHPRGSKAWAQSYSNTLVRLEVVARKAPLKYLKSLSEDYPEFKNQARKRMGLDPDNYRPSLQSLVDAYENWVEHVKASVPASQLLIHKASDGYTPIIQFLDYGQLNGQEEEYPHVNDSKELSEQIELFERLADWWNFILLGVVVLILITMKFVIYFFFFFFWRSQSGLSPLKKEN